MKNSVKSILVLVTISAIVAIAMAVTNYVTAPIIEKNEQMKANSALLEVYPDGGNFETMDVSAYELPSTVSEVFSASNGGYVVKLNTTGYSSGMVIMCGISADGKVVSTKLISSAETPSIGGVAATSFEEKLPGADVGTIDAVDTIASATKTTLGYRNAVKDALNTAVILGGGSVDLRSEEEILVDNLSQALDAANGEFEKYFFTENIEGVDAVYHAVNGSGAVCVIGEKFVGVDENMNVVSEADEEEISVVKSALEIINATEYEDIDISSYEGLPSQLVSARRTLTGNYDIEIKGAGYGITGGDEYHPASNEYIYIRISMTGDGKIIDCLTLSQKETEGIGSVCADESFYGQFDGKTSDNYNDIDVISGATLTTNGYTKAIGRAFECVRIFEEGK